MFLVSACSCLCAIYWSQVLRYVENEDVVGAAPTGDTPTTSEWSTIYWNCMGMSFFVLARYKKIVTISCVQWLKNCSLKCVESVFIWRYLYSNFVYDSRFYSNAVFYSRFMPCLCAGRVPVRTTAVRTPQDAVSWIPYPREGAYSAAISLNISLTIESWRMRLSSSNYWWCVHANLI